MVTRPEPTIFWQLR